MQAGRRWRNMFKVLSADEKVELDNELRAKMGYKEYTRINGLKPYEIINSIEAYCPEIYKRLKEHTIAKSRFYEAPKDTRLESNDYDQD